MRHHQVIKQKIRDYCLALIMIFLIWQLFARSLNRPFLPDPTAVLSRIFPLLLQSSIASDFMTSAARVLLGLGLAALPGIPFGLFLGCCKIPDQILSPLVYLLYPLPKIVFLPLIIVLFGLGNFPKVILISLVVFFQVAVTTRDAARDIPEHWFLVMNALHAAPGQVFRHLVWPACLPRVFTSLRISLGTAIAVLFMAETFAADNGLGYFILNSMERRDFSAMYTGILAMGLLGILLYNLLDVLENCFCRWTKL